MAWDQNLPDGDQDIAQGDDDIRANNVAAEAAIGAEHRFATGGNQSGTHVFQTDSTTNLDTLADSAEGRLAFSDSERTATNPVVMHHDGTSFVVTDCGMPNIPRTDEINVFGNPNWSDIYDATGDLVTAGTPDTLTVKLEESAYIKCTISDDTLIDGMGATGDQAGKATTVFLELIMDGTGGHAVTWDSPTTFIAPYGAPPFVDPTANVTTICQLTKNQAGLWVVTTLPAAGAF